MGIGPGKRPLNRTDGFTIIELIVIVAIIGVIAGIAGPSMSRITRHDRTNRAATVIAADIQNAFALAGRQRAPVRIEADAATKSYRFTDRKTGKVLRIRSFYGNTSEFMLNQLAFNPATIDVYPSGVSSAALTVQLANGDYSRTITASTAGFVRVVPK